MANSFSLPDSPAENCSRAGVSVVIPCYNYGRYLSQAIDSVLNQTFQPLEIIVVDDGSTDNTAAVAAAYGSRIKYLTQANKGVSAARNLGLRQATGKFVHFLDADDYVLPGIYEKMVAAFNARPDAVAVYAGCNWVDANGGLLIPREGRVESADVYHDLILINQWPLASVMTLASTVELVGGFDESMAASCEDWDLWLRLAATGGRFVPIEGIYACYRQQNQGASGNPRRMLQNGLAVISRYARLHGCAKCQANAKIGRREWRHLCVIDKFLPRIEPYLEKGKLGRYLRECLKIACYDPFVAWQCFWRLRQRKKLVLSGLFGKPS
jgi:glycosyltransferase involved in cell wall biosynthesis